MKEEIFGPILPLISYQNIEDTIKIINEGDKPLAIYYFGSILFNASLKRVQQETSSGAFVTNETLF
jgi:acyl-CoA reductase-like NAD-dependent aldehyde dehydrogenase